MGASQGQAARQLSSQLILDQFEVLDDPLGWRCRSCRVEVVAAPNESAEAATNRLAEAAADHSLFCGRCAD